MAIGHLLLRSNEDKLTDGGVKGPVLGEPLETAF